jgi:L-methionine (R)-S-oxide reductase
VPDVDAFPGHIACSSAARSEIVVPIFGENDDAVGVLDVDSDKLSDFDNTDKVGLEAIVRVIETSLYDRCRTN